MKKPIKLFDLPVIWIIWRNPFFTEPVSCVGSVLQNTGGPAEGITSRDSGSARNGV